MNSAADRSIYGQLLPDQHLRISTEGLTRGIDNYHIDVKLSRRFSVDVKKLIALLVPQIAVPQPKSWDNSDQFSKVQRSYADMMTILLHRVKTDLSPDDVLFLQFAPIKLINRLARDHLDREIAGVNSRLAELRNQGASEALAADARLFWLRKHYDQILFAVHKQVFSQLQRVEDRRLRELREQYLGEQSPLILEAMFNPLMWVTELSSITLLLNEFSLWNWNGEDSGFATLNAELEKLINSRLKGASIEPMHQAEDSGDTEIHDELGGLYRSQPFLGAAKDSGRMVEEKLGWIEIPQNVDTLFNPRRRSDWLGRLRKDEGFMAWWRARGEDRRLGKTLRAFTRLLHKQHRLDSLLASPNIRKSLGLLQLERVELKLVCQFLIGSVPMSKLQDVAGGSLSKQQQKTLENLKSQIAERIAKADEYDSLRILDDFSRYRRQLKLYRLAHRAFNRMVLLSEEDDIKLSKSAGTLYQLPVSSEVETEEEKICHHTVLKADVRGSTTVTGELMKKGLNPASYFSMRFFDPINKILETYGATKLFIEGDAIILSFVEHEQVPQQWFSVARACGYARDMLKITSSNNRHSHQMGLPLLELGVGICYSDQAPRFLYDGDNPIMISRAIGQADRMSGCSWKLRAAIERGLFNVEVLRLDEGDISSGEKGQHLLRYNVNGITIDEAAFEKLKQEITLKSLKLGLNGVQYLFHAGQFPDANGKKKNLVIREGKIGLWKDGQIIANPDASSDAQASPQQSYYEVVVNRKVAAAVLDTLASRSSSAARS